MRFGEQLRSSLVKEYYWYYIAYDDLKEALKTDYETAPTPQNPNPKRKPWSEEDEKRFVALLESELDKVSTFQKVKSDEIVRRIKASELEVNDVVSRLDQTGGQPAGAARASGAPTDADFLLLEEDLSDIIADVHDLAKYTKLNYTGFQKIIKKHDKQTKWYLKPVFATRLKAKPFFKDNYDAFVVKLSKLEYLFSKVFDHQTLTQGNKLASSSTVFNPTKEFEERDAAISSIYYDNPDTWELYMGRLKEKLKVQRPSRLSLLRKEGKKSEKQIADWEQLAREIQYRVITRKLVPVTRTFYHRTAFQLPGDARVRISLDTELTMVREDNLDDRRRAGDNWRRMDIGVDYPFRQLPAEDVERFPYAVLEVKLQTQAGQEAPQWIRELISSHLVEAVPKFSKFIHGTANLFPDRINLLPFWMPQMDVDIRKPARPGFGIERPPQSNLSTSEDMMDDDESEEEGEREVPFEEGRGPHPTSPTHEDRTSPSPEQARAVTRHDLTSGSDFQAPGNLLDIEERIAVQGLLGGDDYPLYDSEDESNDQDELEEARKIGGMRYCAKLAKHYVRNAGRRVMHSLKYIMPIPRPTELPEGATPGRIRKVLGSGPIEVKRFKAPRGKRIHVPIRVEPKVYFAAERTFLSWLEFSIFLSTIAATLLNFGQDTISLGSAWAFTILACLALIYSFLLYMWRVDKIRKHRDVKNVYYEKWGPTVLCLGVVVAMMLNFGLRIRGNS
ncbi:vacuolar transporter chaperone [Coccidioides posadasii str. Silveira]|uniref:Vacuolar transporter chaperone n=1 Tax=Coccidioides posadasii (strain RMSCC 757 / Silveira) TaxID=443226 RepID=E9CV41_COCPS|nr:vacuolar transporter chaperone [Coccidioides posadasii str. Silveira]